MYEVSVCSCSSLTVCWLSPKGCTGLYAPETASAVHPAALASLCTLAEERLGFGLGAGAGAGAGCTGVWVYGYAGVWVYGCTGVWVYGCMGIWVRVRVAPGRRHAELGRETLCGDLVRVRVRVRVWAYGRMGVWVNGGCMGVWVYGCMGVWVYGCMGVWVYGCMGVWVYGCMGVWVYGCMGV
jgi:hypothetical protein